MRESKPGIYVCKKYGRIIFIFVSWYDALGEVFEKLVPIIALLFLLYVLEPIFSDLDRN